MVYGESDPSELHNLTQTERLGHTNFRAANAGIVLDEVNNRFSPTCAPIMDRLLRGETTAADVTTLNARVLNTRFRLPDGSVDKLGMKHCWMVKTITFRNKVTRIRKDPNLHLTLLTFLFGKGTFDLVICFSRFNLTFPFQFNDLSIGHHDENNNSSGHAGPYTADYTFSIRSARHCAFPGHRS